MPAAAAAATAVNRRLLAIVPVFALIVAGLLACDGNTAAAAASSGGRKPLKTGAAAAPTAGAKRLAGRAAASSRLGAAKKAAATKKAPAGKKPAAGAAVSIKITVKAAAAAPKKPLPPAVRPAASAAPQQNSWWESAAVEVVAAGRGRINYEAGVVKATGLAAMPPPTLSRSRSQDMLNARDAALADALRSLSMAVGRVRVTADTRVENYLLKSDEVRLRISSIVKNAQVLEEKMLPTSGVYRVVVQARLNGDGSISEAVGFDDEVIGKKAEAPKPDPFAPGSPAPAGVEYTGLIIDCRGHGVVSCISPKVYEPNGIEVYGSMKISADYAIETGIVGFPRSMDMARQSWRAGERPLIVRARGAAGPHRFHPVISERDAERIRDANRDSRFMERTAVLFIVDP